MKTLKRRSALLISLCTLFVLATGCGSSSDASSAEAGAKAETGGASPAAAVVHIKDYAYDPTELDVKAGQQIKFINDDDVEHTATADDKSFDTGSLAPGESKTVTVKSGVTGADSYFCTVHNYMKATVTIGS
ncbi:MAG: cupredoxin domain-containing protein [Microthrixaceae bacterium]